MSQAMFDHDSDAWVEARNRVTARREFGAHLLVYVVVNAALISVWAVTGAGYFWPAWVIGAWAIGLVMHAWEAFIRKPVTDEDIEAELRRHLPPGLR